MKRKKNLVLTISLLIVLLLSVAVVYYWPLIQLYTSVYFDDKQNWYRERIPNAWEDYSEDCLRVVEFVKQVREKHYYEEINAIKVQMKDDGIELSIAIADPESWLYKREIIDVPEDAYASLCVIYDSFREVKRTLTMIRVQPDRIEFTDYDMEYPGGISIVYTDDGRRPKYRAYPGDHSRFRTKKLGDHRYLLE